MFSTLDSPVVLSPHALVTELSGVSSTLAMPMPMPAEMRMSAIASQVKALLLAAWHAPTLTAPDAEDQWAISRSNTQLTVLGEDWSITARYATGSPEYAQLIADDLLMSFDFSVPATARGAMVDMHASMRTSDGESAGYTYFLDGRIMDDDDWTSGADEDIRGDDDDGGSYDDTMAGHFDNGTMRRTATVAGVAAAAAALGGMLKRMSKKTEPSTPEPSATARTAPGHPVAPVWHYVLAGQAQAPEAEHVLRERLARKELPEETLVWNPLLPDWCTALAAGLVTRPDTHPPLQAAPPPAAPLIPPMPAAPEPAQPWHYAVGGKTLGPVEEAFLRDQLRGGSLSGDTLVWNPRLPEWIKASTTDLLTVPAAQPTPIPPAAQVAQPPVTRPAPPAQQHCSRCHQVLDAGSKFCTGCGQAVASMVSAPSRKTCPRCATVLTPTDRFCTGCGSPQT